MDDVIHRSASRYERVLAAIGFSVVLLSAGAPSGGAAGTPPEKSAELRDALVETLRAKVEGLPPFSINYQLTGGVGGFLAVEAFNDPAQIAEYLKTLAVRRRESGSVVVNPGRRLALFEREVSMDGKAARTVGWCDLRSGVTKWVMSGSAYGNGAQGTIHSGLPPPLRDFRPHELTPLAFMYWPFPGMRTLGERMLEDREGDKDLRDVSAVIEGGFCVAYARTWEDTIPMRVAGTAAETVSGEVFLQRIRCDPKRGFLPVRRELLEPFGAQPRVAAFGVPPGPNATAELLKVMAADGMDRADFVISGSTATLTARAGAKDTRPSMWYLILSSAESPGGMHYPTDMVAIERRTNDPGLSAQSCLVTRLTVCSFEELGPEALVDWDFPVGTHVRDGRTDRDYQTGVSPTEYLPETRKQVELVRAYQRGAAKLPEMEEPLPEVSNSVAPAAAPTAPTTVAARAEGGAGTLVWLLIGGGFILLAVGFVALLYLGARK